MVAKVGMSSVLLLAGFCSQTLRAQEPAKPEAVAERPSCRYCPNPDYPLEARKAKIESASVLLEITVTEKGDADPQEIRVIEDPGHGFTKEAIAVVKKWKFKPATDKNGKPTKTRIPVEIRWHSSL